MHCVLFAFHALVVVSFSFVLIIIFLLGLKRCLSVVASAHVSVLHVLDASVWHQRLLLLLLLLLLPRRICSALLQLQLLTLLL
jgi:hypothetical protein